MRGGHGGLLRGQGYHDAQIWLISRKITVWRRAIHLLYKVWPRTQLDLCPQILTNYPNLGRHTHVHTVITGTGVFTPENTISNAELVKAFNAYADKFNAENAADIDAGTLDAKPHSSEEFIFKASGIESRYVIDKEGILKPRRDAPPTGATRR